MRYCCTSGATDCCYFTLQPFSSLVCARPQPAVQSAGVFLLAAPCLPSIHLLSHLSNTSPCSTAFSAPRTNSSDDQCEWQTTDSSLVPSSRTPGSMIAAPGQQRVVGRSLTERCIQRACSSGVWKVGPKHAPVDTSTNGRPPGNRPRATVWPSVSPRSQHRAEKQGSGQLLAQKLLAQKLSACPFKVEVLRVNGAKPVLMAVGEVA